MLRAQYCINCESDYVSCGELIHNNSFEATNHPSGLSYCDGNLENACCWFKLTTHKSVVNHLYVSYPDANSINNYCGGANWDASPNPFAVNIAGQITHLHGCDRMWQGIFADEPNTNVVMTNTIIEDAVIGVYVKNNSNLTAINSKFINNYVGIQYDNYISTSGNQIKGCRFQTNFVNTLLHYSIPGNIGYLLPGYSFEGKRGQVGLLMNYSDVKIQPVGMSIQNKFKSLENGIQAYNSKLKVSNIDFF